MWCSKANTSHDFQSNLKSVLGTQNTMFGQQSKASTLPALCSKVLELCFPLPINTLTWVPSAVLYGTSYTLTKDLLSTAFLHCLLNQPDFCVSFAYHYSFRAEQHSAQIFYLKYAKNSIMDCERCINTFRLQKNFFPTSERYFNLKGKKKNPVYKSILFYPLEEPDVMLK